jgi:apolipoprotein D and lipocalin family protein
MKLKLKPATLAVALTGSLIFTAIHLTGCNAVFPPLEVVENVDLGRYSGTWYEIARYPNSFERGCVGVTAEYTPLDDGRIKVVNTCVESSLDGPSREIQGYARVADPTTNAKLKVTFFWPFEGDYWIIDLAEDYSYAVVGSPSRRLLWILSRTPTMDDELYQQILDTLPARGFDPDLLSLVPQVENDT